jgi:hypothetical protein
MRTRQVVRRFDELASGSSDNDVNANFLRRRSLLVSAILLCVAVITLVHVFVHITHAHRAETARRARISARHCG